MKLRALKDPHIVEINGRRGRAWTGKNENGHVCRVVIFETGGETVDIEIDELKLPEVEGAET